MIHILRSLGSAAALGAVLASAAPAFAADAMSGAMAGPSKEATYVCRPAASAEKPSAMMGTTALVCKPIAVAVHMSDGKTHMMGNAMVKTPASTPSVTGLTTMQLNDAYAKFLQEEFSVPPSP
jgi:hypothetical protein